MIDRIKTACKNHSFVGIVCEDGHEHTIKAFDNVCGTPWGGELQDQLNYCVKIAKGFDVDILVADTLEEAIENDILEENGFVK